MARLARPRRESPTPAFVITAVGLVVLVVTYGQLSWNDSLDQAAAGAYPWTLTPSELLRASVEWTLAVLLFCAVTWSATARQASLGHPWRVPVAAAAGIAGWALTAWRALSVSFLTHGWYVPWPGPVPATTYLNDPTTLDTSLVVRPGILTPVVLLLGVAAVAWSARRDARPAPSDVTPRAVALALAVLGPPIVAVVAAALLLHVDDDPYLTGLQAFVMVVVDLGATLVAAVVAALALGGTGRTGRVLLGLVALAVVGPLVSHWWGGGPDTLLASAALAATALALGAAAHPAAAALSRLDLERPATPDAAAQYT